MFIGHQAVAFALKKVSPERSLGTLMAAAMFLDLLWPIFLALGWERVRIEPGNTAVTPLAFEWYPYSHSLVVAIGWSLLFGICFWKGSRKQLIVLGAAVFSHWVLDAISHRPDLPIIPGSPQAVGLGLWNSVPATLIVELGLFGIGLWIYHTISLPKDATGRWAYAAFVIFLLVLYFANIFGPPPPNVAVLRWVGLAGWLLPLWAGWFDAHRSVVGVQRL
jgi:hypothetical protein